MKKVVFALLLLVFFAFSTTVQAVGNPDDQNGIKISREEFQEYTAATANCETPSLECLVRYTTRFVAMEWVNEILGADNKIVDTGTGSDAGTGKVIAQKNGLIPGTFSVISLMYANPVANTQTYVADVLDSADLAPKAYAQGLGFSSLNPVLNLWKAFRNIAYFFFILLFIVIGFMIMFRQKVSGQAAVTAQQAIPSVIVSLVLVTFSYAIAGFMIDLMYLTMFMIVGIFSDIITPAIGAENGNRLIDMNILQLTGTMFKAVWDNNNVSQNLLTEILDAFNQAGSGTALQQFTGMAGGIIISLVISLAVLVGAFRLFFELLKSYFNIVVGVVTAPIMLAIGAIPGQNVFWPWLKNLIGNLAAFPTVLLVVVLFVEFTKDADIGGTAGGFNPPYLVGSGASGIIAPLMGLAIILALPEIVKKAKDTLGAKDGAFSFIASGAANRFKEGIKATPVATAAAGAGLGTLNQVARTAWNRDRNVLNYFKNAGRGATAGAQGGYNIGRNVARSAENLIEGRTFDPNSWENALVNLNKRINTIDGGGKKPEEKKVKPPVVS